MQIVRKEFEEKERRKMVKLVKTACPYCDTYLQVDAEGYARWQAGEPIEIAMPDLDAEKCKMLVSADFCPFCWRDIFGNKDENEDKEDGKER